MELYRVHLGFSGKLVVDKVGNSEGLCLYWSDKSWINGTMPGPYSDVCIVSRSHLGSASEILMKSFRSQRRSGIYSFAFFDGKTFGKPWTFMNWRIWVSLAQVLLGQMKGFVVLYRKGLIEGVELVKVFEKCAVQGTEWRRIRRQFHFEACWAEDSECMKLVCDNWDDGNGLVDMVGVNSRLVRCAQKLAIWNQTNRRALR
ncbi:hypothetical protein Ddye_016040 [Dipteronia dyeriana]|uniref:Uncharacterized protein n=1 Tax=Dipteronia dyeriana TaxID=168575 RepID=A0AAD9U5Y7_9ROSI|nr:hypothetical protein Ddye_016040 [Dipteronia dyeriana]